jgi:hypothetical protein
MTAASEAPVDISGMSWLCSALVARLGLLRVVQRRFQGRARIAS